MCVCVCVCARAHARAVIVGCVSSCDSHENIIIAIEMRGSKQNFSRISATKNAYREMTSFYPLEVFS